MADHAQWSETASHRASIAHCREVMGEHGESLSDEEVERLCREAEDMARVLIAMFLAKSHRAETT